MTLLLNVTYDGLAAIVAAEEGGTNAVRVTQVGLTASNFAQAPTLTNLPGEFKRISLISGAVVAPNVIHMTAYDDTDDVYDVRGLGLYLEDGTLLATFFDPDPVFRKASRAFGLFVFDITFSNVIDGIIEFGNATFLYPPATESTRGTARIATQARVDAETDAGDDFETIVTPKTLRARLAGFFAAVTSTIDGFIDDVTAQLNAFGSRTITGSGLVTGGGNLTANRVLDVAEASTEEIRALVVSKAMTPAGWAGLQRDLNGNGWYELPGGLIIQQGQFVINSSGVHAISFPLAFPNACHAVVVSGGINLIVDNNQIELIGSSVNAAGFQVVFSINGSAQGGFIAIGR